MIWRGATTEAKRYSETLPLVSYDEVRSENAGMADRHDRREARACFILGVLVEDAGLHECAVGLFQRAISLNPDGVEAHVRLGLLLYRMDDAAGMYEAFSKAVRHDPQAVRTSVSDEEPEEATLIRLVLYPRQPETSLSVDRSNVAPWEVEEWYEQLMRAEEALMEGRDVEAIETLEHLLENDPDDPYPVPLLVLAYLLLRTTGDKEIPDFWHRSMLWKVVPGLAGLLFKT